MNKLLRFAGFSAAIFAFPIFVSLTSPDWLPLSFMVVPFILLFISIYVFTSLVSLKVLRHTRQTARRLAVVAAVSIVMLTVFQSLHQLNLRDVLITAGFDICLLFYLDRLGSVAKV